MFAAVAPGGLVRPTLSAQAPDRPAPGYTLKRWTTADGLPYSGLNDVIQTRDGYIWIATSNGGVARFDGLTFRTFDVMNTPALSSNSVTALFEGADGTLWVGTSDGLARYRDGAFTHEPLDSDDSDHRFIVDIASDADGRIWVATSGDVVRRDGERWTRIPAGEAALTCLWPDTSGVTWIGTAAGLLELRDNRIVRTITTKEGLPAPLVTSIRRDRHGQLWIGTVDGLARLGSDGTSVTPEAPPVAKTRITRLFEDNHGVLWIGGLGRVIARAPDGTFSESSVAGASEPGMVSALMEDREGQLWFGVFEGPGGLYRLGRERVRTLAQADGLPCDNAGAIAQGPDDTAWVSTLCRDGRGVSAIRDGHVTTYPGPAYVGALLAEPGGPVWAGTFNGELFRFDAGHFAEYPTPTKALRTSVYAVYRHADGALWLGTTLGLFRQHDGEWSRPGEHDGLAAGHIRTIAPGPDGSLWIGGTRLSHYENGRFTHYTEAQGLPEGPVRALDVDADGTLWIGTYGGGLARFKDGRFTRYGVRGGALDSSVHRVIEDSAGYLWMSGDRGIRRVSKHELIEIAEGRPVSPAVVHYDEADGMKSAEANGMVQPAGWPMRDGTLWFPTQRGIVRIDPRRTDGDVPSAPLPLVEGATVDGTPHKPHATFTVAPGYRDVEIHYTAPAFARPEQIQFRHRLDGFDADWVDAGTRRVAHYANLPPGRYTFQVTARSGGGRWQEQAATLAIVLEPRWYQRLPFQIALGLMAGLAAVAVGRLRVTRLHQRALRLETTVQERTLEVARQRDAVRAAHDALAAAHDTLAAAKAEGEQAHGQVLAVLNQLDLAVLVLTSAGIVRYASASARRLLGKDEGALVGRSWTACLPLVDADREVIRARIEAGAPAGGRVPVQAVLDGKRFWMEIDVREEPHPGTGRILYIYNVSEVSLLSPGGRIEGPDGLVGRSTAMHLVYRQIREVARVDATVLIEGETGTGKELIARAIHRGSSRANRPFIAVNTAGLAESILASQLFGHRRGAFTGAVADQVGLFEAANGGTLFLDEIGDIPPSVQVSLLRVLQEREIVRIGESQSRRLDVRFLAATHRDLAHEVTQGRFREDLLYRIRVVTIGVPPLRDRLDDLPLLVETFLSQSARQSGGAVPDMSRDAMAALMRHPWPGNVRELKSVIEHVLLRAAGGVIRGDDLPPDLIGAVLLPNGPPGATERDRLVEALRRTDGNRAEAARLLGIGRSTLYRKLAAHGLDTESP